MTSMGARISRRASTMKEMLQQQQKQTQKQQLQQQQQPVKPIGKNNRIQMERQQRRNRGLNLGWVDTSFFSLTSVGYHFTSTMLLNPEVVYFTPGQWAAPPSSVSICICVVYILDVYSSQRNPPQNLLGSLVIALCCSLRRLSGNFFGARDKTAQEMFRGLPALPGKIWILYQEKRRGSALSRVTAHAQSAELYVSFEFYGVPVAQTLGESCGGNSCRRSRLVWAISATWRPAYLRRVS